MADVTFTIVGDKRIIQALSDPMLIKRPMRAFLRRSVIAVEGKAKENAPVDVGRFRASITHKVDGFSSAIVGSNVSYAPLLEFGSRPMEEFPNVDNLTVWARRKGLRNPESAGFLIARHLRRFGRAGRFIFRKALDDSKEAIAKNLGIALLEIVSKFKF